MNIVIIKYNAGNVQSVLFALERIGVKAILSDDANEINAADKVIFPGVGEASSAMQFLKEKKLDVVIKNLKQPTLGICLGMQLMCKFSDEGETECLGIFDSNVLKFESAKLKVPQIGWNTISDLNSKLFTGINKNEYMYFVHSYYAEKCTNTISLTNYEVEYSSALQKNNFYGVQFHPEKSAFSGEKLLQNFMSL